MANTNTGCVQFQFCTYVRTYTAIAKRGEFHFQNHIEITLYYLFAQPSNFFCGDEGEHWTQDTRHNSLNDPPQANPMGSLVSLTTCPSSVCGQATERDKKKKKKIGKKLPFDWCNCHVLHHIAGLIRSPCCLSSIKGNLRSTVFSCGNLED